MSTQPSISISEFEDLHKWFDDNETSPRQTGYSIVFGECPECEKNMALLFHGQLKKYEDSHHYYISNVDSTEFIIPRHANYHVEKEVPDPYRKDFLEAHAVLPLSSKASAALSRRLLQQVLREELNLKSSDLSKEIDLFIQQAGASSSLREAIDAIRHVGNFAAHPIKYTHTGEIVEVESGEAEWLLEVLEDLFDHVFVRPARDTARKAKLNQKLKELGKPPLK